VQVNVVEELGSDAYLYGSLVDDSTADQVQGPESGGIVARVNPKNPPRKGERVRLSVREGELHAFSTSTGLRLPG